MAKRTGSTGKSSKTNPVSNRAFSLTRFKKWKIGWLFIGAILTGLIVFAPALHGPFLFDDTHLPFSDPKAGSMPARFWLGGVRPALMATYWLNFLISGTDTFSYHLVNVAIHAATAVLAYLILNRVIEISSIRLEGRWHALAGSVIFLLHPLQTESVAYIAGRSELVAGFFFAAAWLVFLNHFESNIGYGASIRIICLGGLAILGKESAISLPAILVATDVFWARNGIASQLRLRIRLYLLFGCGALLAAYVMLRSLASAGSAGFGAGVSPMFYALTQCRAIFIYLRLFAFPKGQNGDWQLPLFHSLWGEWAWAYCGATLALTGVVVWLFRRERLASYGLTVFLLMLLPTSSFIPILDALAERRMYMPLTGLILAGIAFTRHVRSAAPLRIITITAIAILGIVSWQRSIVWASDLNLWLDAVRKNPANARAHFGMGTALVARGQCAAAIGEFTTARSQGYSQPDRLLIDLAEAYNCDHKPGPALGLFKLLAKNAPSALVYNRIGYIEATLGDTPAAFAAFASAISLDAGNAPAYAYRGTLKLALDDLPGAEADFREALALDPSDEVALAGMKGLAKARH
jgi:tetratricopeptide (TPR) repeat protein